MFLSLALRLFLLVSLFLILSPYHHLLPKWPRLPSYSQVILTTLPVLICSQCPLTLLPLRTSSSDLSRVWAYLHDPTPVNLAGSFRHQVSMPLALIQHSQALHLYVLSFLSA